MTDWQALGLENWVKVARAHARPRPCAPTDLTGCSTAQVRQAIAQALAGYTLSDKTGSKLLCFQDFGGQEVSHRLGYFCSKLSTDIGHAAHAAWIPTTLADPIEVWDRIDKPGDPAPKRHYFSAYHNPAGTIFYYVAVAVAADGTFITAFQKDSGNGIDRKRNGDPVHRCY